MIGERDHSEWDPLGRNLGRLQIVIDRERVARFYFVIFLMGRRL